MGITNPSTSKGHPAWVTTNLGGSHGKVTVANRATSATTRVKGLAGFTQQKSDSNKNLIVRKQISNNSNGV